MATLEQIVYNIAENVGREHDQPFLERLRFMVPTYRSTLIRRDEEKGRKLDREFMQTLEEVELEEVSSVTAEVAREECPRLRSKFKIPALVRLRDSSPIRAVTAMDGMKIIHPIEFEAIRSITFNRFIGHEPRYYMRGNHLWLINASAMESVQLEGIFDDPFKAELFNNPNADILNMEYPVSRDFVQYITELILKIEATPADPTNDDVVINE